MEDKLIVTKSQLINETRKLGLAEGQTVMLHASVKNIGWIVGGPQTILEALLEILTPNGTLMMLASWEDNPYDLDRWPEKRRQSYLEECPAFDPRYSRADIRKMGILTEYLRTWPGSIRSRHPFGYTAVGKLADHLVKHEQLQYRDGSGSPLEKLCEVSGKVLLLGSPTAKVTLLHHAENLAQVPNKRVDRYKMPILQNGERTWVEFEEYDTTKGIVPWPDDYFQTIVDKYINDGHGTLGAVGMAKCHLFDAESLKSYGVDWMERHFNETR
ncbi:aminoglycoside 3-N-acetyltransferase [Candidatus Hydrogenedentota bacterium]